MPSGTEVVIGVTRDPQFGPVMMFGLGGVMVEALKDVAFRVMPLTAYPAEMMLREIRARAILEGVRGKPGCDRQSLIDLMVAVSDLIEAYPEISEMDLNPVICYEKGYTIVDARIVLKLQR
jgi:acetyltransferase